MKRMFSLDLYLVMSLNGDVVKLSEIKQGFKGNFLIERKIIILSVTFFQQYLVINDSYFYADYVSIRPVV